MIYYNYTFQDNYRLELQIWWGLVPFLVADQNWDFPDHAILAGV